VHGWAYVTMARFQPVPKPSIIPSRSDVSALATSEPSAERAARAPRPRPAQVETPRGRRLTFTDMIGAVCMFPLTAIINLCVALRIHPNVLTLIGVIVNVGAAWALGFGRFVLAGFVMIV